MIRIDERLKYYPVKPKSANSAENGPWIDMKAATQLLLNAQCIGAGTLTCKLQQATDSSGANAKDITGKTIAVTSTGSADKSAQIRLASSELDYRNNFRYARAVLTPSATLLFTGQCWVEMQRAAVAQDNVDALKK